MLHSLVLVYLLSFVSGKFVPENGERDIEWSSALLADQSIVNSAIIEHVQELLNVLTENTLSGKIKTEESKFWCTDAEEKACKEKCEGESTIGNIRCITSNFLSDLVFCSSGYSGCTDDDNPESCRTWSYPSENWTAVCPYFCDATRQSPINILVLNNVLGLDFKKSEFTYINYTSSISTVNIKNNGHSASISWDTSINTPSISGGGLGTDYTLINIYFHWGCENDRGSEHTIDGDSHAMEMHLVHYKTSYGNLENAIKYSDGLAVLGILFKISFSDNLALKPITDNLSQITEPDTETDIEFNVALFDFLPAFGTQSFHRYQGSLTTPPCNEVVVWSVFDTQAYMSQGQIDAFRSMKNHHNAPICDNFRNIQPLNGRSIQTYNFASFKKVP